MEMFNLHKKGSVTQLRIRGWLALFVEEKVEFFDEVALFYRDTLIAKIAPSWRPDIVRVYKHIANQNCSFDFSVGVASNVDIRRIEIAAICRGKIYKSPLDLGYVFNSKSAPQKK